MFLRNSRLEAWLKDVFAAVIASIVAYPIVGKIWMAEDGVFSGFLQMQGGEWLVLFLALFIPSALLGILAGRIARWRFPERAAGMVISGGVAFAASAVASGAFLWWLSMVL